MKPDFLFQALKSFSPEAEFSINNFDINQINWYSTNIIPKPSKEEIEQKIIQLKKEWEQTQYQRDRAPHYPSLADFADAYYWTQKGDESKMNAYIEKCDEVKEKYPKP